MSLINDFQCELRVILENLNSDENRENLKQKNIVPDTQNTQHNSGQTFESYILLENLTPKFNLKKLDLTTKQKKKFDSRATAKSTVYKGYFHGEVVHVIDLPKQTPDFIIIYREHVIDFYWETKSIFSKSSQPKMNAGLNNPSKVHRTLYLVYKRNENRVIIRHGKQVLSEEGAKVIKKITELQEEFVKSQSVFLSEANLKYQPALRFEFAKPADWEYCKEKEKEALDIFFKGGLKKDV